MNELLFVIHILFTIGLTLATLKFGQRLLIGGICMQVLLSNIFVTKQITLFGLTVTSCEAYIVGSYLSLNLLQEYFSKKALQDAIITCLFCIMFVLVCTQIHLRYSPSEFDTTHIAYEQILSQTPRVFIASILSYFVSTFIDIRLFSLAKRLWPKSAFWRRSLPTALITQAIDTIFFAFVGLWGLVHNIFHIIAVAYLIKVITLVCLAPMTLLVKKFSPPGSQERLA
jgi:queuosine precursor transporter